MSIKTETLLKKYIFLNDIKNQFTDNIDFSKTSVTEVAEKSLQTGYTSNAKNVELHDYIFKFYAYNEILASLREKQSGIISKDDLKIFSEYEKFINDFSKRVFSFILHACIAEARYANFGNYDEDSQKFKKDIKAAYVNQTLLDYENKSKNVLLNSFLKILNKKLKPEKSIAVLQDPLAFKDNFNAYLNEYCSIPYDLPKEFINSFKLNNRQINPHILSAFEKEISKTKSIANQNKLEKLNDFWLFLEDFSNADSDYGNGASIHRKIIKDSLIQKSKIKDFSIEEVFEYLSIFFKQGFNDKSGSFGGEPWSNIAKHGLSFAQGKINSEVFIDQALSLEHNNGQMFNKNFIFQDNFSSHYFNFLINEDDIIENEDFGINIKDFILHLQNSSSVLSLSHFDKNNWANLITNLNNKKIKEVHSDLSKKHISLFSDNFKSLSNFSEKLKFLPEMTALAKKIDYSIPSFDFSNLMITAFEKREFTSTKKIEHSLGINQLFSNIVAGHYASTVNLEEEKVEPSFNFHNLNNNNSKILTKEIIGGKAKGLIDLINKGFNVPKAMVFDTQTCLSYLDNPKHFNNEYKTINKQISDYLIDENNKPLLVSVRSGAPVSMPGMMDSILNVGIDDTTYQPLCEIYGKAMINECIISFMHQFCASKLNLNIKFPKILNKALDKFAEILIKNDISCDRRNMFPLDKESQIKLCVEAVFDSWNSSRAFAWRNEKKISHKMGTAATIQQMVFGNRNDKSLTCVIFSRDCINGKSDIMGEYLVQAQGEDLVSGKKTPLPIIDLKKTNPKVYKEIEYIAKVLELEKKSIQDLEITVENGKVYVLQMRNAVVSPEAQLSFAKELDLNLLDIVQLKNLIGDTKVDTIEEPAFNGLAASPGLISGIIVKNEKDIEKYKSSGKDLIFFSNQALPEHAPIMIATQAFITEFGGSTSHAAILARSMGKPCVVGIGKQKLNAGQEITMDAINGKIWMGELPILINQTNAIKLSKQILKENNILIPNALPIIDFSLKSWTTQLSNSTMLDKPKNNKNKMFLNIAQQTALLLKVEHNKKNMKVKS